MACPRGLCLLPAKGLPAWPAAFVALHGLVLTTRCPLPSLGERSHFISTITHGAYDFIVLLRGLAREDHGFETSLGYIVNPDSKQSPQQKHFGVVTMDGCCLLLTCSCFVLGLEFCKRE